MCIEVGQFNIMMQCTNIYKHSFFFFFFDSDFPSPYFDRCTKNVKFHFQWDTKPQDQKQETGNDYDVISGLQALRKTDFLVIFLL